MDQDEAIRGLYVQRAGVKGWEPAGTCRIGDAKVRAAAVLADMPPGSVCVSLPPHQTPPPVDDRYGMKWRRREDGTLDELAF